MLTDVMVLNFITTAVGNNVASAPRFGKNQLEGFTCEDNVQLIEPGCPQ
jgi:hypothetical protein